MRKDHLVFALVLLSLTAIVLANRAFLDGTSQDVKGEGYFPYDAGKAINADGDLSLGEAENRVFWNPHSTGLTDASVWSASFRSEAEVCLRTVAREAGHVAAGAWWSTGFKSRSRLPLCSDGSQRLVAIFRAYLDSVDCETGSEWLRVALACAMKRCDGTVVYTEMDFWDSAAAMRHPSGDVRFGGDVLYRGGDVVEYKVDQAAVGEWRSYSLDLTGRIDSAWTLVPGDLLESVYVVIEAEGGVTAALKVDDLWIMRL